MNGRSNGVKECKKGSSHSFGAKKQAVLRGFMAVVVVGVEGQMEQVAKGLKG